MMNQSHRLARLLRPYVTLLALLACAGALALPPGPRAAGMRAADDLFVAGRYYEALRAYQAIDAQALPEAALRLGMLRAIRGEHGAAEWALRAAMQAGLGPADYQLALVYLGQTLAASGRADLALKTWALTDDCRSPGACAYQAPARLLRAELAMGQGDYAAAEAGYRLALSAPLPAGWAEHASYRLALLRAAADPAEAARLILAAAPRPASWPSPLLAPLLPAAAWRAELAAALSAADREGRPQRLGQVYLGLGRYDLAEAQFARVRPDGRYAQAAAVYGAYARWLAGDRAGGLDRLRQLVDARPDEPQARMLLALAYLSSDQREAAQAEIEAAAELSPSQADMHLAWASWYVAGRDYARASAEYDLARAAAGPDQRGRYALLGAQFHLTSTYELCEGGLPLAEAAAAALPDESAAWTTLAAHQYYCGQPAQAVESARRAGDHAESAYYLGAALAALGQPAQARSALIRAADLAPASPWRERAEAALAQLP